MLLHFVNIEKYLAGYENINILVESVYIFSLKGIEEGKQEKCVLENAFSEPAGKPRQIFASHRIFSVQFII